MHLKTKSNLVKDAQIEFGTFHEPIERVNLIDADAFPSFPTPKWFKNIRLKEFQAFQGGNEDFFFNIALFNAKVSAFAQIRIFYISTGEHYIYEKQLFPTRLNIPDNVLNSQDSYVSKSLSIKIENKLSEGFIKVKFQASQFKGMPDVEGEIIGHFENAQHIIASIPFAEKKYIRC